MKRRRLATAAAAIVSAVVVAVVVAVVAYEAQGSDADADTDSDALQPPSFASLRLLSDAVEQGARCLDGSPAAYYIRRAPSPDHIHKWVVFLEGGGWCSSLDECLERSRTQLGSSKKFKEQILFDTKKNLIRPTREENPLASDWNHVFVRYCDGGSFGGANMTATVHKGETLYFRGLLNLQHILLDLEARYSLSNATDLILTGSSAGGLAVFLHADLVAEKVPEATVIAVPDSGFFIEADFPDAQRFFRSQMRWIFYQQNMSASINQECRDMYHPLQAAWKCAFPQHSAQYTRTNLFPIQSRYDSWQVDNILGSSDPTAIILYGKQLETLLAHSLKIGSGEEGSELREAKSSDSNFTAPAAEKVRGNGIFLESCFHHCGMWNKISILGKTQTMAISDFYQAKKGNKQAEKHHYIQGHTFPCQACCFRLDNIHTASVGASKTYINGTG